MVYSSVWISPHDDDVDCMDEWPDVRMLTLTVDACCCRFCCSSAAHYCSPSPLSDGQTDCESLISNSPSDCMTSPGTLIYSHRMTTDL